VANQTGGVFLDDGHAESSTIANNCGVGVNSVNGHLENSIVYGNTTDLVGTLAGDASNLIGTIPGFVAARDYHLAINSSAIDQGDGALVPAALTLDGDGQDRVLAASDGGTPTVDIGWDEWSPAQAPDVVIATGCGSSGVDDGMDGGVDGGMDAGFDGGVDGGTIADGGVDGGFPDASIGVPDAGTEDTGSGCDARCSIAYGRGSAATPFALTALVLLLLQLRTRARRRARSATDASQPYWS